MAAEPLRRSDENLGSTNDQINATEEMHKQNFAAEARAAGHFSPDFEAIYNRVRLVITNPTSAWKEIKTEQTTIESLYLNYIVILAAIPAICQWVSGTLFGYAGIISGTVFTIVQFLVNLVVLFVYALIIENLSGKFDGTATRVDGLKLLAYSATPMWIGGILTLVNALAPLTIICAIWGLYLYFKGIPVLSAASEEKAISFMFTSIGAFLLVALGFVMLGYLFGFGFFAPSA